MLFLAQPSFVQPRLTSLYKKKCLLFIAPLFYRTIANRLNHHPFLGPFRLHSQHGSSHGAFLNIPLFRISPLGDFARLSDFHFRYPIDPEPYHHLPHCGKGLKCKPVFYSDHLPLSNGPLTILLECSFRAATSRTGVAACRKGSLYS